MIYGAHICAYNIKNLSMVAINCKSIGKVDWQCSIVEIGADESVSILVVLYKM